MKVALIKPAELDDQLIAVWSQIQRANVALRSPFFRPEFTQLCARVHGDVEIAVIESNGRPAGFFPFHRITGRTGMPIGKDMSDFHGVIAPADLSWDLPELMQACELDSWSFDHLIASQTQFNTHTTLQEPSWYVDLTGGFSAYTQAKRAADSKGVERTQRSERRLIRDEGELDFRLIDAEVSTLSRVLDWQQQNLRRKGTLFLPQKPWHETMYRESLNYNTEAFSGWYSTLRTSHGMISGNIFLRSYDTAHWWLTAYDAEHSQHSPSAVAILHALKEAAALGITRVDFGRGRQELKRRLMSSFDNVGEGLVEARPVVRVFRRAWQHSYQWVWNSSLKTAAKDAVRRWRTWCSEALPLSTSAACKVESSN